MQRKGTEPGPAPRPGAVLQTGTADVAQPGTAPDGEACSPGSAEGRTGQGHTSPTSPAGQQQTFGDRRICGHCGKSSFSSYMEGLMALLRIEWRDRTKKIPTRVYYDRGCGVHHLTSQEEPSPQHRQRPRRRRPGRAKVRSRARPAK